MPKKSGGKSIVYWFLLTKEQDVDKIFDRVGICVTRETREIIRIDFLTDTRFTYIGSCFVEKVGVWDFWAVTRDTSWVRQARSWGYVSFEWLNRQQLFLKFEFQAEPLRRQMPSMSSVHRCVYVLFTALGGQGLEGAQRHLLKWREGEYPCHREKCRCNWQLAPFYWTTLQQKM